MGYRDIGALHHDRRKTRRNHFPFTIANLKSLPLPPAGKRPLYYDTETPGCAARHSASGELVFYIYRKVAGDPIKVALGPFDPALPASREIPRGVDPLDYIGNRPRLNPRMARMLGRRRRRTGEGQQPGRRGAQRTAASRRANSRSARHSTATNRTTCCRTACAPRPCYGKRSMRLPRRTVPSNQEAARTPAHQIAARRRLVAAPVSRRSADAMCAG